jgi:hypothetical protein
MVYKIVLDINLKLKLIKIQVLFKTFQVQNKCYKDKIIYLFHQTVQLIVKKTSNYEN